MTYVCRLGDSCSCSGFEQGSCHNSRAIECHCGKRGHALNSVNCPVHGSRRAESISKLNHARAKRIDLLTDILRAIDHTLTIHGHIDAGTPLHDRIRSAVGQQKVEKSNGDI
jgi:hypothetical protein